MKKHNKTFVIMGAALLISLITPAVSQTMGTGFIITKQDSANGVVEINGETFKVEPGFSNVSTDDKAAYVTYYRDGETIKKTIEGAKPMDVNDPAAINALFKNFYKK